MKGKRRIRYQEKYTKPGIPTNAIMFNGESVIGFVEEIVTYDWGDEVYSGCRVLILKKEDKEAQDEK